MFERFTGDARAIVVTAQQQARDLGHSRVGSEHVLLGLLAQPSRGFAGQVLADLGIAAPGVRQQVRERGSPGALDEQALSAVGIDLARVRRAVEDAFGPGALERTRASGRRVRAARSWHIPFNRDAKQALEGALREARRLRHNRIGGEHILLGLFPSPAAAPPSCCVVRASVIAMSNSESFSPCERRAEVVGTGDALPHDAPPVPAASCPKAEGDRPGEHHA